MCTFTQAACRVGGEHLDVHAAVGFLPPDQTVGHLDGVPLDGAVLVVDLGDAP